MPEYTAEERLLIADIESRMLSPEARMAQALGLSKTDIAHSHSTMNLVLTAMNRRMEDHKKQAERIMREQAWPITPQKTEP
jgi:hypothetical protein